ncbi:MAG: DNA translocase FtsK 4TM domain-containing protein [Burkholderiaceae bacterium]|jgi:S-DNA-T family DNA segregation ATPase FtsK/SpoIIIE|nr:DNA translocase FtsK 4TM domain-containing protein [Burkholderiaceae bacterium]
MTSYTSPISSTLRVLRFAHEISLIVGCALLLFWLLSMFSYSPDDPAWSTSGTGGAVVNWCGHLGAWVADISYYLAGYSVWWCLAAGLRAWLSSLLAWLRDGKKPGRRVPVRGQREPGRRGYWERGQLAFWGGLVLLLCASTALEWSRLYGLEDGLPGRQGGGVMGYFIGPMSVRSLGFTGSALAAIAAVVIGSALVFRFSWFRVTERVGQSVYALFKWGREKRERAQDTAMGRRAAREREEMLFEWEGGEGAVRPQQEASPGEPLQAADAQQSEPSFLRRPSAPPVHIEPALIDVPRSDRELKERQQPLFHEMPDSRLPQIDLLDPAPRHQESVSSDTLEMTSRLIEKKLKDFGVSVHVVQASPGPVITRYEIEPAIGVKGSQVVNLAKDLARSLSLVSIRVIETIPGKNYMALELPNVKRQMIRLSEILGSQIYSQAKSRLSLGLGKDIVGNPFVVDLAKMPHVLVAGTTGSGKSVGINAMILSMLYKAEPSQVRLLMIDPKMLEMSTYEGIPHLLAPVVTDMKQAANALNWCVGEMERRYRLMSKVGVRNLAGFNVRIDEAKARGEFVYNPLSLTPENPEPLSREPHIVVVIDELADLMMVVGKKIEELIARLAQKARAAGIHLILATQRPSVDVITGLIKANIPTRIAFQVSSKIDSRTILDQMGAEALLGAGDMLYMASGTGLPVRVHGAFVSDDEVHRVVSYLRAQGEPDYIEGVLEGGTVEGEEALGGESAEKDPLYDQAVEIVLKNRKASISLVQRHLSIGYNKAANLLDAMESAGLVSSMNTRGQREILVPTHE